VSIDLWSYIFFVDAKISKNLNGLLFQGQQKSCCLVKSSTVPLYLCEDPYIYYKNILRNMVYCVVLDMQTEEIW
jgi:hypothetical protein